MATTYEVKPFWDSIWEQWRLLLTGSLLAVGLALLSLLNQFGVQTTIVVSPWVAALIFTAIVAATIICAVYRAGKEQHQKALELAEKLKPKLEIAGIGPFSHEHHRIMVHNKTGRSVEFRAKLLKTKPELSDFPTPVDLQPTHCKRTDCIGEIGPNGDQPVDVVIEGPTRGLQVNEKAGMVSVVTDPKISARLKLMGAGVFHRDITGQRIDLLIGVYPLSESGEGQERWFYVVPQPDGKIIFTADGAKTVSSEGAGQPPAP